MGNMEYKDMDLSQIGMCIKRLCGIKSSDAPPTCEKDECPGVLWKLNRQKKD